MKTEKTIRSNTVNNNNEFLNMEEDVIVIEKVFSDKFSFFLLDWKHMGINDSRVLIIVHPQNIFRGFHFLTPPKSVIRAF